MLTQTREYYERRLAEHGPTARGVDWNSELSQNLRFAALATLLEDAGASVLDYGCGYGALLPYLRARGHLGSYCGFDISERMIEAARESCPSDSASFSSRRDDLQPMDYAVASGVFNVKQGAPVEEWERYVFDTIDDLAGLGRLGFAFNALTIYSDADRRRPDLYYADPLVLFDRCARRYSRRVAVLQDSPLYEFTMLVRR